MPKATTTAKAKPMRRAANMPRRGTAKAPARPKPPRRETKSANPETVAALIMSAPAVREAALDLMDEALERAAKALRERDLTKMKPSQIGRMMGQVARARRDVVASLAAAPPEKPAAGAEAKAEPILRRETQEEWNARHAPPEAAQEVN